MARRGRPRKALHSVMPTRERAQHDLLVVETPQNEGGGDDIRQRARVLTQCHIDTLLRRKLLTPYQYLTACDVKNLAFAAVGEANVVSSYSDMTGAGSIENGLAGKVDAFEQYIRLVAIIGHTRWRTVRRVVVEDRPAGSKIRMKHLRDGLDLLDGKVRV